MRSTLAFSKKLLIVGLLIGIVVGYAVGFMTRGREVEELQQQVSRLNAQIEQLRGVVQPLRVLAEKHGIYIGAAVGADQLRIKEYAETLSREFNILTTENALKFERVHPERNVYSFSEADAIISFAEANGMKVRGHTLVWHNQLPEWITRGNYSREEWIRILHDHVTTVVNRYRGRVYAWDVVNEAVDEDGSLRETIWLRNIGPEYIELAFKWAHEADPEALLFYNDYGAEGMGVKSDAVYNLVKTLLEKGVPIHGVGLQMHVSTEHYPAPQEVVANIKRLGDLGLEVHITEIDVRIRLPADSKSLVKQAEIYRDMLKACLSSKKCTAFVMWGFTDRYSWIPGFFNGYGSALIFDENYNPKPAYYYILRTLMEP
ncbi:MAG: endo-1,4-beta-xylanase [Thaumarchaeota archaeon]|jgi:endo-1,4-beta-xylanase|nr:endo-1,4-beta-xylanase [Nitrososphaerota archaeon]